ncbi:hypothetical protein DFJ74DRAFT_708778 [Hyaloraphidium curvatum]|nr:hypothetical protein DFJ74DRAFT_708778 [Hyaloraphidium curvatum]
MAPKRKAAAEAEAAADAPPAEEAPAKRGRKAAAPKTEAAPKAEKKEPAKKGKAKKEEDVKDEPEVKEEKPVPAKSAGVEALEALKAAGFKAQLADGKPRRGAFNFIVRSGDKEVEVWDGLTKGPPRSDKFPDLDALVDMVRKAA